MATATKRKPAAKAHEKKTTRPASDVRPAGDGRPVYPELPVAAIDPHPANPRTEFDQAELDGLTASLKSHGLIQPIVVRPLANGRYQVIAGGRRLQAAKAAGWKSVPATIRNVSDDEALTLALVENVVRCDLNPVEMARAVAQLCAPTADGGCAMSQVDAGAKLSRDASWVRRQIQLLTLPDCWLRRVATGEIGVTMSKALLPYANRPSVLARIEDDMLSNPWSWRTAEDFERNAKLLADDAGTKPSSPPRELKPMRATPGNGERQRESRADDGHHTPAETPAAASTNDADDAAAALRADRSVTPEPATTRIDVAQIVMAIYQLDDLANLARIANAVEERRAAIKRLARESR